MKFSDSSFMTARFKHSVSALMIFLFCINNACAQSYGCDFSSWTKPEINMTRLTCVIVGASSIYLGSMGALYYAWYKDKPMNSFHFHNDIKHWLQMDKGGHVVTSYYIGRLGYRALRFAEVSKKKSAWYGGSMGSVYLTTIELFDGFSPTWGASVGDLLANSLGSALFISQQLVWQEQRLCLKYSYHNTRYAAYRPDVLGAGFAERMIKDYNGISYWLSANINAFGWEEAPAWLNIAVGYSADGMTGGLGNVSEDPLGRPIPHFERKRQFLLSLDIDLTRIKTRSSTMNMIFELIGFIKVPFPTLELDSHKNFKFHPLYF